MKEICFRWAAELISPAALVEQQNHSVQQLILWAHRYKQDILICHVRLCKGSLEVCFLWFKCDADAYS